MAALLGGLQVGGEGGTKPHGAAYGRPGEAWGRLICSSVGLGLRVGGLLRANVPVSDGAEGPHLQSKTMKLPNE